MKKFNILVFFSVSILCLIQCTSKTNLKMEELTWLNGSWITPDSSSVETWAFENGSFSGNSFSTPAGKITERLSMFSETDKIYYEATVLNQNDAQPIKFELNSTTKDSLHFTNLAHDFPNDIIYKRIDGNSIYVKVYSKTNPGFDYIMTKI